MLISALFQQPIGTFCIAFLLGCQPISDHYFLGRSVPALFCALDIKQVCEIIISSWICKICMRHMVIWYLLYQHIGWWFRLFPWLLLPCSLQPAVRPSPLCSSTLSSVWVWPSQDTVLGSLATHYLAIPWHWWDLTGCIQEWWHVPSHPATLRPAQRITLPVCVRNRPNQEVLVPDWLITNHLT